MIAVGATGCDVIDIAYCKANGIVVANIRNYAVHTVPEHAFTLITALRRNLLAYRRDVENGRWQQVDQFCFFDHPIRDLHGAIIGLIGEGALGQATARIARGFGMNVLFADHAPPRAPGVVFTPLAQVLAQSDVISLHLPLTDETRKDRKSTRLNSSHSQISYAVFCLKKKNSLRKLWASQSNFSSSMQESAALLS